MKHSSLTVVAALALLLVGGREALAQEEDVLPFEVGVQFSLLSFQRPTSPFSDFATPPVRPATEPGVGARLTYNLTNVVALEAEGNHFPNENLGTRVPSGHIYQAQFGVKAGKRFKKFGLFMKARPGFVIFTKVSRITDLRTFVFHDPSGEEREERAQFGFDSRGYFSADVGGVVEFYPTRRIVTRFDLGDTIIRYGVLRTPLGIVCVGFDPACRGFQPIVERPAETKHNLQFSVGIGVRF